MYIYGTSLAKASRVLEHKSFAKIPKLTSPHLSETERDWAMR